VQLSASVRATVLVGGILILGSCLGDVTGGDHPDNGAGADATAQ